MTRATRSCALLVALLAGCSDDGGPRLDSAMPEAARANTRVVLAGRRLCGESGDCAHAAGEVQIGLDQPVRAVLDSYGDASATIVIPPAAPIGATVIVVTVNERSSNALEFEVLP